MALQNRIADYEEDLVQASILALLTAPPQCGPPLGQEEIERAVKKIATEEAKRRRSDHSWRSRQADALRVRTARNPREIHRAPVNLPLANAPKQKGIPCLCPRFERLAKGTGYEERMDRHVLVAAAILARAPKFLQSRQFHAFTMAYIYRSSRSELGSALGTTERGVTETLSRIVDRLDAALVKLLLPCPDELASGIRNPLQPESNGKKSGESVSALRARTCGYVIGVLGAFVDRYPSNSDT